ncbi:MAG: serine O-acetyltransferase [Eubacterium sp.]|nr:serine O-acetyltransferase [Eubacterium sp.]
MTKELEALFSVGEQFENRYKNEELLRGREGFSLPNRSIIIRILKETRKIMFPGYFFDEGMTVGDVKNNPEYRLHHIGGLLSTQVLNAISYSEKKQCDPDRASKLTYDVIGEFPKIQDLLLKDVEAGFDGDPAAQTRENVIISYPGLYAIFVYRVAHELYVRDIPYIPRIMTEFAHSRTGIDINAGAKIGEYFFIDHGTGVVIGETTEIGDHVKIYQGVTLGALSTRKGQGLAGVKRHPTIEDNVTIYANSTILGGETVIGHDSVISGNTFIVKTVPAETKASNELPQVRYAPQYDVPFYGDNI